MSSIGGNVFGMKSVKGLLWEDITIPQKNVEIF